MQGLLRCAIVSGLFALLAPAGASAQSAATIPGPRISKGTALNYAAGFAQDTDQDAYAIRLALRHAVSDRLRFSTLVFCNDRGGEFRYRHLTLEAMYQFISSEQAWNSALQFRGRLADGNDGADRVRVAWLNSWPIGQAAELRLIGLAAQEFGPSRKSGLSLETRAEMSWPAWSGERFGIQLFNKYGTTEKFGAFDTQQHSFGGVIKGDLSHDLSYRINILSGLSEAAPDFELRAAIGHKF